ncbi:MAG TPA: Nramp family divalent metal transporter [Candidatus Saccharimonadales bacterium]|nr:Nramp family divalent metal transporter [Candidatus Saccharimonadales bacterium]
MEEKFEELAAAPSIALEKGIAATKRLGKETASITRIRRAKGFWANLGPGLITGAADDDPSGIATYSQAGAQYGYQLLWMSVFTLPLMAIVQEMCARIGLTTGRGLAGNIRINYPRWVLYTCAILLFSANTLNIAADIGAMSKATQLLAPNLNFAVLVSGFTFFCLMLQIFTPYQQYVKYLKYLVLVLASYVITAFIIKLSVGELIMHTFIPTLTFSKNQLFLITAILGTTISPYLFFWQTSHEVEEEILHGRTSLRLRSGTTDQEIRKMRIDVWIGMIVSNLVMYSIIATCAAVLFSHGITNITSAADAAAALKPLAGEYAFLLFAAGIIGMGLLAVPILAGSAAYTMAESFKWKSGLYRKLHEARPFYGIMIFSMIIAMDINFLGINPIKLLLYSAIANGLVAPVILFLIVHMTSNKKVVKERVNSPLIATLGWFITGIMILTGIGTIISLFIN